MPVLSGVDVCRRIAASKDGPLIYRILLTSRTERQDLIEALQQGAHDFQSKPVDPDELRCRLKVGERLIEAEDRAAHYAAEMESLAEERARQLVHADRLASLGTLSAGIAHEINNPVGFISGNAQTQQMMWRDIEPCLRHCLETGYGEPGKLEFILNEMPDSLLGIRSGVERVTEIVSGLKAYVRKEDAGGAREAVDLNACIEDAINLCHNALKYHVEVSTDLAPDLPHLLACSQQIIQVLVNILGNAADAIGTQNGTIHITSSHAIETATIVIEDSGPGIPPDVLGRLFDPFFTTKPVGKGTGLGLSVSKGIVEAHGGSLKARNGSHGGACFTIELKGGAGV